MTLLRLVGVARHYDWGSATAIPALLGTPPDGRPCAEVWYGAHPAAPAWAVEVPPLVEQGAEPAAGTATGAVTGRTAGAAEPFGARPLDRIVADDPVGFLGARCVDALGPRLPFLVKLLAAARPLSLQVHPDRARAAAGYAREVAAGVAPADRWYADGEPKPEALLALAPTRVLAGLRPPDEVAADLAALGSPALRSVLAALGGPGPDPRRLAAGLAAALHLPRGEVARATAGLARPAKLAASSGPAAASASTSSSARRATRAATSASTAPGSGGWAWCDEGRAPDAAEVMALLRRDHPDDPGVVAAAFLRSVLLAPGDVVVVPPGTLHAYLEGVGVEVMASSDTVLRAGLTSKPVDVDAVLAAVDPAPGGARVLRAGATGPLRELDLGFAEFAVTTVELAGGGGNEVAVPGCEGPRVVVGVEGLVAVTGATAGGVAAAGSDGRAVVAAVGGGERFVVAGGGGGVVAAGSGDGAGIVVSGGVVAGNGRRLAIGPGEAVVASDGTALRLAGRGRAVVVHVPPCQTAGAPGDGRAREAAGVG
jgi:mannose-6-phosphate isomerase